ncbi:GIY-YIG nuclease family protein [Endobacterium cereale]|uniref:GIY-YIG nuclease family protein n=1 Tax=Endobacterium cereale TaxID=2663029 RepID=UPI002B479FD1|nr:GIY-YIG nuclease family protein [Endobacterium cereale]MEB2843795.1 GIY-YIG nuclease family protein [Endobacterium cereale]
MPQAKICGVYAIENTITNRVYYGSAKDVANRKASHFWQLRNNRHKNHLIQADFDAHGADAFEFQLLELTAVADLRTVEQRYIDQTPADIRYNLAPKATGGGAQNERTIERMRRAHTGKRHTLESIAKLKARPAETNGSFKGYYRTPEGLFASSYEAADAMGGALNFTTIRRWCQNPDKKITKQSFRKSAYLQGFGERVIGMTPNELGFNFDPKA